MTRGTVTFVLIAGLVGCTTTPKKPAPEPVKPLSVSPPKPAFAPTNPNPTALTPLPTVQPTGRNGTTNVPIQPTSGGTLRPTPIESPVLPTITAPTSGTDSGVPTPPSLPGISGIDPKNISPPTPVKIDAPALPK